MCRHLEVLGLKGPVTQALLRAAYLRLVAQHHPDTPGGSDERMKEINVAYDALKVGLYRSSDHGSMPDRFTAGYLPCTVCHKVLPSSAFGGHYPGEALRCKSCVEVQRPKTIEFAFFCTRCFRKRDGAMFGMEERASKQPRCYHCLAGELDF